MVKGQAFIVDMRENTARGVSTAGREGGREGRREGGREGGKKKERKKERKNYGCM
jgi:hypothetical protein